MTPTQTNLLEKLARLKFEVSQKYKVTSENLDFEEDPVFEVYAMINRMEKAVRHAAVTRKLTKTPESQTNQSLIKYPKKTNETPYDIAVRFNTTIDALVEVNGSLDAIYANNVINVPVSQSGPVRTKFQSIPTLTTEGDEAILGRDISRTFELENVGTEDDPVYELLAYAGYTNLQQGITHRLRTTQGEVSFQKQFGIIKTVLNEPKDVKSAMDLIAVDRTLRADPRVLDVVNVQVIDGVIKTEVIPITSTVEKSSVAADDFISDPDRLFKLPPPPALVAPTVTFAEEYPSL